MEQLLDELMEQVVIVSKTEYKDLIQAKQKYETLLALVLDCCRLSSYDKGKMTLYETDIVVKYLGVVESNKITDRFSALLENESEEA